MLIIRQVTLIDKNFLGWSALGADTVGLLGQMEVSLMINNSEFLSALP